MTVPEHPQRCSVCGRPQTTGWPLITARTRGGESPVCQVGPCHRLAILHAEYPPPRPAGT